MEQEEVLKKQGIIIRSDDFDFRMEAEKYIAIHEEFIKAGLIETANTQFTQWGRLQVIPQELIDYINSHQDSYDIQIHGWGHFRYDEEEYDFIVRDLSACIYWCQKLFNVTPTVFYPPWNCMSNNMERAAEKVGLRIDNESNDIAKFIREAKVEIARDGIWRGHSVYFHGWKQDEMEQFPEMLKLVKEVKCE